MKNRRLNRSLSSIKSLAPYYLEMRARQSSDYDFRCRCCGETLEPEKLVFELLGELVKTPDDVHGSDARIATLIEEAAAERSPPLPDGHSR